MSPCSNPMVTGTSVLGVKFTGGVIIAADMLGSYGSLARFRNISRLMKVRQLLTVQPKHKQDDISCSSKQTNVMACGLFSGERQHHPGSFRRLRWLPVPEAGHRTDGVSRCSHSDGTVAALCVQCNAFVLFPAGAASMRSCWVTATATVPRRCTPGWPEWCTTAAARWILCGTQWWSEGSTMERGDDCFLSDRTSRVFGCWTVGHFID